MFSTGTPAAVGFGDVDEHQAEILEPISAAEVANRPRAARPASSCPRRLVVPENFAVGRGNRCQSALAEKQDLLGAADRGQLRRTAARLRRWRFLKRFAVWA